MSRRLTDADFMPRVSPEPNTGCWLWDGSYRTDGYGSFSRDGVKIKAHRYSYERHIGPTNGLCVLHQCDNRACVNPSHLHLGTRQENTAEAVARDRYSASAFAAYASGRKRRLAGEANGRSKLTESAVREAVALCRSGVPVRAVASRFGVSKDAIQGVLNGKKWAHLGLAS